MIGIYKITSPSNRVYIGQSTSIATRFKYYKKLTCKGQVRLYESLKKHGAENHVFEIIEECNIELLNERERHWQELHNVISKKGLNCRLTKTNDKSGKLSDETKLKLSISAKNVSKEVRIKRSINRTGRKHSTETLIKMSNFQKNRTDTGYLKTANCKKVINILSNKIYGSLKLACEAEGYKYGYTSKKLSGKQKNNTLLKYL
jgi:group I intron endonuclease